MVEMGICDYKGGNGRRLSCRDLAPDERREGGVGRFGFLGEKVGGVGRYD